MKVGIPPPPSLLFCESRIYYFLRIIRSNQSWRVVESFSGVSFCLERLALSKGYRVVEVCRALGCSSRYLHTLFIRDIGLPPKQWMNLERMVVARRKLEGGKCPKEVALELGFRSKHPFCRQFEKFYQTSPEQFQLNRRTFDPPNETTPTRQAAKKRASG